MQGSSSWSLPCLSWGFSSLYFFFHDCTKRCDTPLSVTLRTRSVQWTKIFPSHLSVSSKVETNPRSDLNRERSLTQLVCNNACGRITHRMKQHPSRRVHQGKRSLTNCYPFLSKEAVSVCQSGTPPSQLTPQTINGTATYRWQQMPGGENSAPYIYL